MGRSCEKRRNITMSHGGQQYSTTIKWRPNGVVTSCVGRNGRLKHVTEGKIEGRIEATGRRGRRHKQLLDDLKEERGYRKLTEEVPTRTLWRIRFRRGHGSVVWQQKERVSEWVNIIYSRNSFENHCLEGAYHLHPKTWSPPTWKYLITSPAQILIGLYLLGI